MIVHSATMEALGEVSDDYEVMPCDPGLADTAQFCEAYGVGPEESANTIMVASRKPPGHMAACVVLATTRLDVNGVVRKRLGVRKVSFASADITKEVSGMEMGGVTPFGLPDDLPIWIDTAVMDVDSVIVGAGSRTAKIRCSPQLLASLGNAEVVEGLAEIRDRTSAGEH